MLGVAGGVTTAYWGKIKGLLVSDTTEKDKSGQVVINDPPKKECATDEIEQPRPAKKKPGNKGERPPIRPKGGPVQPVDPPEPPVVIGGEPYPRRALLITVHNYLYANPTQPRAVRCRGRRRSFRNFTTLERPLSNTLRIPINQIAHLSDAASKGQARSPIKSVIEKTLTEFLDSSRAQDRLLVFFVGHAVEIGDEVYSGSHRGRAGQRGHAHSAQVGLREARGVQGAPQKVFVVDVCRFSPTNGAERPAPTR